MKSYKQFADEMSEEDRQRAQALFDEFFKAFKNLPPLMCYSDRPTDAEHFKLIDVEEIEKSFK